MGAVGSAPIARQGLQTFQDTTTPLAANASFFGNTRSMNGYTRFRVIAASDMAGTVVIQVSEDGNTWFSVANTVTAVPAGFTSGTSVEGLLIMPYVRCAYVNGAGAQTQFELASSLVP